MEDYIIPDEELEEIKEIFKKSTVDVDLKCKLQKTIRKQDYSVSTTYKGPDMDVLKDLASFDSKAWLIVNKLLAYIETLKKKENEVE